MGAKSFPMQCARMQPRRRVITVKARLLSLSLSLRSVSYLSSPPPPFPLSSLPTLRAPASLPPSLPLSFLSFFLSPFAFSSRDRLLSRDSKTRKEKTAIDTRAVTRFPVSIYLICHRASTRLYRDKSLRRTKNHRPVERSISIL